MIPMTADRARALARGVLWGSLAFNVGVLVGLISIGAYGRAGLQSIIVAALASWIQIEPTVHAWLDAKCQHACLQRRMAEQAHAEIVKHVRQGTAQFQVTGVRLN